ncbi:MAG: cyclic nucleotide-binding domain-containing protein [Elusimicrobiaceae bacterium]|nr:cyclic nucleotide-binding domain-containing protein [Elusimicrobiaceae bacterium]
MRKLEMTPNDSTRLFQLLRSVDFFEGMTMGQLQLVVPHIMMVQYEAGEKIVTQGEKGDSFYVVADGDLSVTVKKGFFGKKELARLASGDFFGEMALIDASPRNATVTALTQARLFVLFSHQFVAVMNSNPDFASHILRVAQERKLSGR